MPTTTTAQRAAQPNKGGKRQPGANAAPPSNAPLLGSAGNVVGEYVHNDKAAKAARAIVAASIAANEANAKRRTVAMPDTRAARIEAGKASRAAAEAAAAASNAATLAARPKPAPVAKALDKPTETRAARRGIGVAMGATEGQPHTARAVEQAIAREDAKRPAPAKGDASDLHVSDKPGKGLVQAKRSGGFAKGKVIWERVWVRPTHPHLVNGILAANAREAREGRAAFDTAQRLAKIGAGPIARNAKAKRATVAKAQGDKPQRAAPAPKAARKLVVVAKANPYAVGSKAHATFGLFQRCKTDAEVRAEVERTGGSGKGGKYDAGYLRYSARDGHIRFA